MDVAFTCSLSRSDQSLELAYTIDNREAYELGLFNRIAWPRPDGTIAFSPDLAYVELEGGRLLVSQRALPIPEGLRMAAYVPPNVSRIAAHSRVSVRIVLPIAVTVMQPFQAAKLRLAQRGEVVADQPATARSLRLEVGIFPVDAHCKLVAEHPAHPDVFSVLPPGPAIEHQQLLVFDAPLDPPLPVSSYRVEPWP